MAAHKQQTFQTSFCFLAAFLKKINLFERHKRKKVLIQVLSRGLQWPIMLTHHLTYPGFALARSCSWDPELGVEPKCPNIGYEVLIASLNVLPLLLHLEALREKQLVKLMFYLNHKNSLSEICKASMAQVAQLSSLPGSYRKDLISVFS